MYYLQTRYYDPAICRFISPDELGYLGANGDLTGYNLYAYCSNNPVNYADPTGNFSICSMILGGTFFGAAIGALFDVGKQLIDNGGDFSKLDLGSIVNSAIVGGALGFSLAMGVAYLGPMIAGTATTGWTLTTVAFLTSTSISFCAGALGYATEEWINGRSPSSQKALMNGGIVAFEGAWNFGVGGVVGSVGKIGTKGDLLVSKEWWGKLILGMEFSQPFKIGLDLIRKNL